MIYGILSPLCPGEVPDIKFYTNHLRSSTGYEYEVKTFSEPLYIKDFAKVEYFMKTIMRDIYKYSSRDMFSFSDDPQRYQDLGKEDDLKGLPMFKNYYFVPIQMETLVDHPEDLIDWPYIDMIKEIHDEGVFEKKHSIYDVYQHLISENPEMSSKDRVEWMENYMKDKIFIKGNKPH